jgi:uncharacterized membrane protein
MDTGPQEKRLKMAPFTIQVTRGLLRHPGTRRKAMAVLLVIALVMIGLGLFGMGSWLAPRDHAVRFIFFWFACGWITLTAVLLALLDLLLLRAAARQASKALGGELEKSSDANADRRESGS